MKEEANLPITSVKIGTLEERLRASEKVPLDSALRALAKQAGTRTKPNPIHKAIAYRRSMQNPSKTE